MMRRLLVTLLTLLFALPAVAQVQKRLWLLEPPDKIVELDPLTFAVRQTVSLPAEAMEAPRTFSRSACG